MNRIGTLSRNPRLTHARRGSKGFDWYYKYKANAIVEAEETSKLAALPLLPKAIGPRQHAFLEFSVSGEVKGRVTFELASDLLPMTCDNFLQLCQGDGESELGYKSTAVHRLIKDQALIAGDVEHLGGAGGVSAFGTKYFEDEGFIMKHSRAGALSMVNAGVDMNASQFLVTLGAAPQFDGRLVGFGEVVEGMAVIDELNKQFTVRQAPVAPIQISDCGKC